MHFSRSTGEKGTFYGKAARMPGTSLFIYLSLLP